jgi:hypothetical protein
MSLDLPQIIPQVNQMGRSVSQRLSKLNQVLPQLLENLNAVSTLDQDLILERIERAGQNWPGAIPTNEPLRSSFPPPALPNTFHVIASDGSQILPDRHAPTRYYLINTGGIHIRYGSGETPEAFSNGNIYYEDQHLYDERGFEISASVINGLRDLSELETLAQLTQKCLNEPSLALLDNGLLLWLAAQSGDQPSRQVDRILRNYLQELTRIQGSNTAIAGFIDRPRHANVIALLHLCSLDSEEITEDVLRVSPYMGIPDQSLFKRILEPGYRSALFVQNARLNRDFKKAGHEVYFFYLHTGHNHQIARVEVPQWVALSYDLLSLTHAALIEQCKLTGGYPYALVRAHELAVVTNEDRQTLDAMIQNVALDHGWVLQHSLKSETKKWTGKRRRHRL